jgi:hypothetical protein
VTRYDPGYFGSALGDLDLILERARRDLKGLRFDTIVGTGLSGTLVVPHLARGLGRNWLLVRKEESPHSTGLLVGWLGTRWLFVDDIISSGLSLKRVQEAVTEADEQRRKWEVHPKARCVGAWLYEVSPGDSIKPPAERGVLHRNTSKGPLQLGYVWTRK